MEKRPNKSFFHCFLSIFYTFFHIFAQILRKGRGPLPQPRGVIDKPILEHLTFGQSPFLNVLDTFFLILGPRDPVGNPFQPISRPCSIEIMYPREWRIAIPASLMRVEQACSFILVLAALAQISSMRLSKCESGSQAYYVDYAPFGLSNILH